MSKRGLHCLTSFLLLVPAAEALAGGVQATRLDRVEVQGETPLSEEAEAASTGLVGQEQLENRPISRPAEVLEVVPGLIATQHSGDGKGNQYFLRGFNLDHGTDLAASVDGIPNNLRTHGHGQGYNDLNALIPELIETIEYRKGPYSADDGDFASAASVHIRYRDSLPTNLLQYTAGENGYNRALLAGSAEVNSANALLAIDGGTYDGPWQKAQDARRISMIGRLSGGDAESGYRLGVSAYRNRWEASDQIPRRAVSSGVISEFGQIDPDLGGDTRRYSAFGEWRGPAGPGKVLAHAYATRYKLNLFSNFTYFLDDPERGDQFEQVDDRSYYGGSVRYVQDFGGGDTQQELSVGLETRRDDIDRVGLYHTERRERIGTVRQDAVEETSVAAFVNYDARLAPWMRGVLGLRADHYRVNVHSDTIALNSGSATDTQLSPKASVVLGPWARTELFLNGGRGFHSNDARGATLRVEPTDPGVAAKALDLIVPTTGYELGLRTRPTDSLSLTAVAWSLRVGSELVFLGDGGTTEASRASRRQGIELSALYNPSRWLTLDADYSVSRARFRGHDPAGDRIPGAVENVASLGVTARSPQGWFGGLRFRYIGPASLIEDDSVRSHSTSLFNAEVGRNIGERWRVALEALNVFDSRDNDITYFYESQMPGESSPVADEHFHPVEPRQVRVTFAVHL